MTSKSPGDDAETPAADGAPSERKPQATGEKAHDAESLECGDVVQTVDHPRRPSCSICRLLSDLSSSHCRVGAVTIVISIFCHEPKSSSHIMRSRSTHNVMLIGDFNLTKEGLEVNSLTNYSSGETQLKVNQLCLQYLTSINSNLLTAK